MNMRLLILILALTLSACAHGRDAQGYLRMPEQYLENWDPHSSHNFSDMKITRNKITQQDVVYSDPSDPPDTIAQYKVFDITTKGVYAIVKDRYTLEHVLSDLGIKENGTKEEQVKQKELQLKILQPYYEYWYFSRLPYTKTIDIMIVRDYGCDLTEKDWHAPAKFHAKNVRKDLCQDYFSQSTWSAKLDTPRDYYIP